MGPQIGQSTSGLLCQAFQKFVLLVLAQETTQIYVLSLVPLDSAHRRVLAQLRVLRQLCQRPLADLVILFLAQMTVISRFANLLAILATAHLLLVHLLQLLGVMVVLSIYHHLFGPQVDLPISGAIKTALSSSPRPLCRPRRPLPSLP